MHRDATVTHSHSQTAELTAGRVCVKKINVNLKDGHQPGKIYFCINLVSFVFLVKYCFRSRHLEKNLTPMQMRMMWSIILDLNKGRLVFREVPNKSLFGNPKPIDAYPRYQVGTVCTSAYIIYLQYIALLLLVYRSVQLGIQQFRRHIHQLQLPQW